MFRLRAQNIHGWSEWSEPYTEILAASPPAKMAILVVETGYLSDTAIRVSWITPNSQGSEITGFNFMFKIHDDTFVEGNNLLGIDVLV